MKCFKIAKSKMQALAKYLFRKCRTLQLNRSRDVTNFEILDFFWTWCKAMCARIAAHMRSGNLVRSRMTRRKCNWYEANRNHWHWMHSTVFYDLWLLYKISWQREKNSALLLVLSVSDSSGMMQISFFFQFHKLCYLNVRMIQHGTWCNLKRHVFPNVWQILRFFT